MRMILSRPTQVTSGEPSLFQIRELPDGRLLALGSGVWTMNSDASHRTKFGHVDDPRFIETCGRSVLVVGNKYGNAQLTRFGLDGSSAEAITGGDVLSPVCSPDEKFVYYLNFRSHRKDSASIYRGRIYNGNCGCVGRYAPRKLSNFAGWQTARLPLSAVLASFGCTRCGAPSKGGQPIIQFQVPSFLGHIRWSPKGDALQYLQTQEGATNLWEQRLDGGGPRQLTHFSVAQIFDFDWSHDQKRLLMTRGELTRDVVLIENFQSRIKKDATPACACWESADCGAPGG